MSHEAQTQAWIDAALKDVRQVVNSPWLAQEALNANSQLSITSQDTTGPNFIAAASVLIAVESVARLALGLEEGTAAATEFLKSEFPGEYSDVAHVVWTLFRHGHIHNFLPQEVTVGNVVVRGRVMWMMPSPQVDHLAAELSRNRAAVLSSLPDGHLDFTITGNTDEYLFNFYPQIAYVDLVAAVASWRAKLASDPITRARFAHGIRVVDRMRQLTPSFQGPIAGVLRSRGMIPK